jgi:hypothetical protein
MGINVLILLLWFDIWTIGGVQGGLLIHAICKTEILQV